MRKVYNLQALNFLQNCSLNIGLFGGSFNPAHPGHLRTSSSALKFFEFDYIIWLVALQNPMKPVYNSDIFTRALNASNLNDHPRILISTAEHDIGTSYLYKVLRVFREKFPSSKFSWLMGADNLVSFNSWEGSAEIICEHEIIVFDRPGSTKFLSCNSKFTSLTNSSENKEIKYYYGPKDDISSTEIRKKI